MAFERRFNAIRFYSKLNHFVLSPRKKAEPFRFKNSSEWFCGLYKGFRQIIFHITLPLFQPIYPPLYIFQFT